MGDRQCIVAECDWEDAGEYPLCPKHLDVVLQHRDPPCGDDYCHECKHRFKSFTHETDCAVGIIEKRDVALVRELLEQRRERAKP